MTLHLIKLSVGTEDVADLAAWHQDRRAQTADGFPRHITRMWPKKEAEVLAGSIYWVIKGVILCRQRIVGLEQVESGDGITRCAIVLDQEIVRTQSAPRRPFQGWRYLSTADAPPDLMKGREHEDPLPPGLAEAMAEFGLR